MLFVQVAGQDHKSAGWLVLAAYEVHALPYSTDGICNKQQKEVVFLPSTGEQPEEDVHPMFCNSRSRNSPRNGD